jgi:hypothetical protein
MMTRKRASIAMGAIGMSDRWSKCDECNEYVDTKGRCGCDYGFSLANFSQTLMGTAAIVALALPISAQLKTDLWQAPPASVQLRGDLPEAPPASQQFRNDYAVSVEGL